MTSANLHDAIYSSRSDRPALIVPGGPTLSYADLERAAAAMSIALASRGVVRGDRVSFLLEKSPLVVVLAHACLRLGAVLHPLNTSYTDAEIAGLLADAEPRLLVGDTPDALRLAPLARTAAAAFTSIDDLCAPVPGKAPPVAAVSRDDTAAILYTSGTTGRPKGAMITHANLVDNARALAKVWRLTPDDVLLHALPVFHAHGLLAALNSMLIAGGSVLFLPRFEAREVIAALPSATVMMGVPTFYARLLKEPDIASAMQHMRVLISGSAPLPLELAAEFHRITGKTLIERYGTTEAAIITAVPPHTKDRTGWVGWPLPGIELRLIDEGKSRTTNGIGVLETRGHNVFRGYWRNDAADKEAFCEGKWFNTGDIAEIDAEGCVRLLGREKDLIITGGLNVYPKEIETVLDTLPGVETSAVFGVSHPDFGEAVVAAIETKPGATFDENALIAGAREKLAAYKTPKRILAVPGIPRNRMGKVDKKILRDDWKGLFTASHRS
jgi:malonyl-CoA/methylmalonyl-CoA synthetase